MKGRTISHYRVEEELGSGGMGVVYRASDARLHRDVALKVLHEGAIADEESRRRFRREALALSRLNHPAIETIHEFDTVDGLDFLVMEYLRGEPLSRMIERGPLPPARVLAIGVQIAEALADAHSHGVVHRDLKPANIMILPDGRVKVLDFGLATLTKRGLEAGEESLTVSHAIVGTPRYMAPEQVIGGRADVRTDVYAAGLVLYESATGRHPFADSRQPAGAPAAPGPWPIPPLGARPGLGTRFDALVARCLEPDPARRFESAGELAIALEDVRNTWAGSTASRRPATRVFDWTIRSVAVVGLAVAVTLAARTGCPRTPTVRSLAVLPIANLSKDPDEDVFAQGMTEELCTSLTQVGGVRVVTRTAALRHRDTDKPLSQLARELKVEAVVAGSLLRSGDRVRITAQLVRAPSGEQLWAERYESASKDAFELQHEMAEAIASGIRAKIRSAPGRSTRSVHVVAPEAKEAYLKGRYFIGRPDEASRQLGLMYLEQAVALDSLHAQAWASLAEACVDLGLAELMPASEAFSRARIAARRALTLDDRSASAHSALAHAVLFMDWDWSGAERGFRRSLALDPGCASGYGGRSILRSALGRHVDAIADAQRAQELDPLSLAARVNLGARRYYAGELAAAEREFREVLEMDGEHLSARAWLGRVALARRLPAVAIDEYTRAPSFSTLAPLATAIAAAGNKERARGMLRELAGSREPGTGRASSFDLAILCLGLGDREPAMEWLERAASDRAAALIFLKVEPLVSPLRDDPRFGQLLRSVGLPS